jgi:hypothetical protein
MSDTNIFSDWFNPRFVDERGVVSLRVRPRAQKRQLDYVSRANFTNKKQR